jgi:hypothetical protein
MSERQLYRILQQILLEQRVTRQYVQFLHEIIAHHEIGKEAGLQDPQEMRRDIKTKLDAQKQKGSRTMEDIAAARAANGLPAELTEEERALWESGDQVPSLESL